MNGNCHILDIFYHPFHGSIPSDPDQTVDNKKFIPGLDSFKSVFSGVKIQSSRKCFKTNRKASAECLNHLIYRKI